MIGKDFLIQVRTVHDPEARSRLVHEIAMADGRSYDESVVRALIELLSADEDPDVQQWVTVALRKLRRNPLAVAAMWRCFRDPRERESIRACAIHGLGHMGESLSDDELRALYRERRVRVDDALLTAAIHWTGRNSVQPSILQVLLSLEADALHRQPANPVLLAALAAATRRCARGCLAAGTIDKDWLVSHGQGELLEKLGETRIQRLIEAERARRQQPPLLKEFDAECEDIALVPGYPLADFHEEQYIEDLLDWKNVRLVETRSFLRDQALARDVKRVAGYACEICGDRLPRSIDSRRFVHVHHVQPLSEGGANRAENMLVVCPSCHGRLHAREIEIQRSGPDIRVRVEGDEWRDLRADEDSDRRRADTAVRQILSILRTLAPECRLVVLGRIRDIDDNALAAPADAVREQ